jgi:hypothetical protein
LPSSHCHSYLWTLDSGSIIQNRLIGADGVTGLVTEPAEAEMRKAAELVMETGRSALVDVVCSADG